MRFLPQRQLGNWRGLLCPQDIPLVLRIMGAMCVRIGREKGRDLHIPTDFSAGFDRFWQRQQLINAWRSARRTRALLIFDMTVYASIWFGGEVEDRWCYRQVVRVVLRPRRRSTFYVLVGAIARHWVKHMDTGGITEAGE